MCVINKTVHMRGVLWESEPDAAILFGVGVSRPDIVKSGKSIDFLLQDFSFLCVVTFFLIMVR